VQEGDVGGGGWKVGKRRGWRGGFGVGGGGVGQKGGLKKDFVQISIKFTSASNAIAIEKWLL